jgi:SAM-dependent methyltransferase
MEREEYRRHYELEESHWWFRSRRTLVFRILRRRLPSRAAESRRLLDAGCGAGINLARLADHGRAFGCDLSPDALAFCRERNLTGLVQADVRRLPFRTESFDLVTFFDVLYHKDIPDDTAVLREACRVLRAGGYCLITDSALERLRGPHDEAHHGARRYDKDSLGEKLRSAGFEIVHLTYFYLSTYPAVSLRRRLERRRAVRHPGEPPRSDLTPVPRILDAFLGGLVGLEARIAARFRLPIGSSIVALAIKAGDKNSRGGGPEKEKA